jgi:hypothetical protein
VKYPFLFFLLPNNFITLTKNTIKRKSFTQSIFVISNNTVMKAIEHTKHIAKNIIHLVYSTCTNDLIVYSKQASNIELFILAFFIECNRLFIADSIAMNTLQKYYFKRMQAYVTIKNNITDHKWFEIKNTTAELLFGNKILSGIYHKENSIN